MQWILLFLIFLTIHSFALQPLEGSELAYSTSASPSAGSTSPAIAYRAPETIDKNEHLSEAQIRFKAEIQKLTGKVQTIYKDQLHTHNIPNQSIRFQYQINKDGSVQDVEANKNDMTSENTALIATLLKMFKESRFSASSEDYSTPYKFCFYR